MNTCKSDFITFASGYSFAPLDASVGLLLDIEAEQGIRERTFRTWDCDRGGSLEFLGEDVRNRGAGRLACMEPENLNRLRSFSRCLYARLSSVYPVEPA
jgi:hypothetical protein